MRKISDNNFFPTIGCCEWWTKRSKKVATLEFDRVRKSMSVIARGPTGHNRLLIKVTLNLISLLSPTWFECSAMLRKFSCFDVF